MKLFDRYTIEKWKEFWTGIIERPFSLGQFLTMRRTSPAPRIISLGCLTAALLAIIGLFSSLRPDAPIPPAKQLTLTATDTEGNIWTIDYLKDQNIEALLNSDTKPGQPLKVQAKLYRKTRYLLIEPVITGHCGEQYFPGTVKNGQWQPAPKVAITDRNGKLLHRGQFEYG